MEDLSAAADSLSVTRNGPSVTFPTATGRKALKMVVKKRHSPARERRFLLISEENEKLPNSRGTPSTSEATAVFSLGQESFNEK